MADSHIATGPTLAAGARRPQPEGASLPDRLDAGDAVGDYVVEHFLGAGAMGDVYAGRHPVIGKKVAIKVLKRELSSDKEAAERFTREARAVNQIDHANVIDVFNFGQLKDDGRLYLVMDLVDGKSLRRVLEDGPLPVDAALDILAKIADALDAAHARGVIHRDLKPDNVMLSSSEPPQVYVLDFGIAKLFSATATNAGNGNGTLTGKGVWLGTPGYMSPEQWSAEGAGPASDRYALGVMAYELLSGVLPFKATTLPQMMEQHFRSPVPALSQRGTATKPPEHHQTLDPVLARAMAKSPEERFPTAKALVEALRAASKGRAVEAPAKGKRSLAMPAVAGASVLGIAVVGVILMRPGNDDDDKPIERERPAAGALDEATVRLEVITRPPHAKVSRDGQLLGESPVKVDVKPGQKMTLSITKAGYRAITDTVTADKALSLVKDLQPIQGFEGVWSMPDGKLRGFWRSGEKIEVYRLETVTGDRELWRTCELVDAPAGADAMVFATTAEITDERAHHGEVGCSIPHRIEYKFDPAAETLEVRAEKVETARRNGSCIVVSRSPGDPIKLARADGSHGDTRITQPPVGKPVNVKSDKETDAVPNDTLDNKLDGKTKAIPLDKSTIKKPAPPPIKAPPVNNAPAKPAPKTKADLGKPGNDVDEEVQKKAPPKQAPSKQAVEPPIQKSQAPIPNAPEPQAQAVPRGDSQQAK
jgi:tRNA A-37 threonylcarbamoyl transferase component Bud32